MCHGLPHVDIRGQLGGLGSLLSYRVWGLNSGFQAAEGERVYFVSRDTIYYGGQGKVLVPAPVCGLIAHQARKLCL